MTISSVRSQSQTITFEFTRSLPKSSSTFSQIRKHSHHPIRFYIPFHDHAAFTMPFSLWFLLFSFLPLFFHSCSIRARFYSHFSAKRVQKCVRVCNAFVRNSKRLREKFARKEQGKWPFPHQISLPCFGERTRKTRSPKWWFGSRKVAWKAAAQCISV